MCETEMLKIEYDARILLQDLHNHEAQDTAYIISKITEWS